MAAAPFASIRIAERFRSRASTTTPDGEPSARATIRTATVRASRRPQQAKADPQAPAADPAATEQAPAPAPRNAFGRRTATVTPADTSRQPLPGHAACGQSRQRRKFSRTRRSRRQARAAPEMVAQRPRRHQPRRRISGPAGQFAARRLADRREGRQGPDRAMRRQSLRLFRRREVEPERRTGPDQHEARQGLQMERPNSRSEYRQHL